ncbi:MAG: hypothetical protein Q9187_003055 [Circinaria calcarea]
MAADMCRGEGRPLSDEVLMTEPTVRANEIRGKAGPGFGPTSQHFGSNCQIAKHRASICLSMNRGTHFDLDEGRRME